MQNRYKTEWAARKRKNELFQDSEEEKSVASVSEISARRR
jgi:hypothetical protein